MFFGSFQFIYNSRDQFTNFMLFCIFELNHFSLNYETLQLLQTTIQTLETFTGGKVFKVVKVCIFEYTLSKLNHKL